VPLGLEWQNLPESDYEMRLEAKEYQTRVKRIHVADKNGYKSIAYDPLAAGNSRPLRPPS
jgi:hypothetical protein